MKQIAKDLFEQGHNCCEVIIMAADKKYNLNIPEDTFRFVACTNYGFGIGSLCGAIISGVMIIGYIFKNSCSSDSACINKIRMEFIDNVNNKLQSINCSKIIKVNNEKEGCKRVVSIIADVLEKVIKKYS